MYIKCGQSWKNKLVSEVCAVISLRKMFYTYKANILNTMQSTNKKNNT